MEARTLTLIILSARVLPLDERPIDEDAELSECLLICPVLMGLTHLPPKVEANSQ